MSYSYRRLSVPPLAGLEGQGRGSLGGGSSPAGVSSSVCQGSSTVSGTHPHAFLRPHVHQGGCSGGGHSGPHFQGSGRTGSLPSPGFYSRLFVVWKTSGLWCGRPRGLGAQFVLSVRPGDWMVSIDLREAYLQIPVHPESRNYLRFVAFGRVYQFRALCFGLASVPQVFTRVMAPVSSILHSMGIRLRRYLDDWLTQPSSREAVLRDLRVVLDLCMAFGIVVNPEKSNFVPSQKVLYLGTVLDSRTLVASSLDRIARLLSLGGEFLSSVQQPCRLLAVSAGHFVFSHPSSAGGGGGGGADFI